MTDEVKINIAIQGAPVASHAYIMAEAENIVAIAVDFQTKYCELHGSGSNDDTPAVYVGANTHSLHVDESRDIDDLTDIEFPDYKGWHVWAADFAKYTLSVCLIKANEVKDA